MPISGEMDDGPTVLQLYKWEKSQPYLELSKFREASISPTRRLFGLLSDHGDLVLSTVNAKPSQVESPTALSDSSLPVFKCFSSIPRVKSLAWGHCCDASSKLEVLTFSEFLVLSSDDSITVHAFCDPYKSTVTVNGDTEELHGDWKEWFATEGSLSEDGESGRNNCFRSFLTTISGETDTANIQSETTAHGHCQMPTAPPQSHVTARAGWRAVASDVCLSVARRNMKPKAERRGGELTARGDRDSERSGDVRTVLGSD